MQKHVLRSLFLQGHVHVCNTQRCEWKVTRHGTSCISYVSFIPDFSFNETICVPENIFITFIVTNPEAAPTVYHTMLQGL